MSSQAKLESDGYWSCGVRRNQFAETLATAICLSLLLSTRLLAHGDVHEQILKLSEQISQEPTNAAFYLKRGELHRQHRDWRAAEKDYRQARKLAPELASVKLCLGRMYLDASKPGLAQSALDEFIARQPHHALALSTRARALSMLGKHLKSARDYTAAIATFAENRKARPEYYLLRARELVDAGPPHEKRALRGLDEGSAALGNVISLQLLAIEIELKRSDYDSALRRVDTIARRAKRKESWLYRQGEILERAGKTSKAREAYEKSRTVLLALPHHRIRTPAMQSLNRRLGQALKRCHLTEPKPPEKQEDNEAPPASHRYE